MKTENRLQQDMFVWHWNTFVKERGLLFHVPNENQHRLVKVGVVPGVADLVYLCNKTVYFIEVKTQDGKQTRNQKKWEKVVKSAGYKYFIIKSLDEFKELISYIQKL